MQHKPTTNKQLRERRHSRIRARVAGTATRPRLAVFRSNRYISAQLIDDTAGKTVAAAHGRDSNGAPSVQAANIGKEIAKAAKAIGIDTVVFDRGGYRYAGNIKSLAEAARAGGLNF